MKMLRYLLTAFRQEAAPDAADAKNQETQQHRYFDDIIEECQCENCKPQAQINKSVVLGLSGIYLNAADEAEGASPITADCGFPCHFWQGKCGLRA